LITEAVKLLVTNGTVFPAVPVPSSAMSQKRVVITGDKKKLTGKAPEKKSSGCC
jgi:hypothetical protein